MDWRTYTSLFDPASTFESWTKQRSDKDAYHVVMLQSAFKHSNDAIFDPLRYHRHLSDHQWSSPSPGDRLIDGDYQLNAPSISNKSEETRAWEAAAVMIKFPSLLGVLCLLNSPSVSCSASNGVLVRPFREFSRLNSNDIFLQVDPLNPDTVKLVSNSLGSQGQIQKGLQGELAASFSDQRSGAFCLTLNEDGKQTNFEKITLIPTIFPDNCPLILGVFPRHRDTLTAYEWLTGMGFFIKNRTLKEWTLKRGNGDSFNVIIIVNNPPIVKPRRISWSPKRSMKNPLTSPQNTDNPRAKL